MVAVTRQVESGDFELTVVCLLQTACAVTGPDWLLRKVTQQ